MRLLRRAAAVFTAGAPQRRFMATHTPVRGLETPEATPRTRSSLVSDDIVDKMVNILMYDGKKATAAGIVQDLLKQIKLKNAAQAPPGARATDPMDVLVQAIENAKPLIETRPVRVGGSIYQVPTPVPPQRRQSLAIRWIVKAAREKKSPYTMSERLYKEVMDCYNKNQEGAVMKKRMEVHKQAEANRAYAHFRWW